MAQIASLRMELFVQDMDAAIDFYHRVLGFAMIRRDEGYASMTSGGVVLGLGPIAKLPTEEGYFTQRRLGVDRGAGVEIVLEVDDIMGFHERVVASGYPIVEGLRTQPWGLTDFRMVDPDGYYLRITSTEPSAGPM